jgi:hypothetical protein
MWSNKPAVAGEIRKKGVRHKDKKEVQLPTRFVPRFWSDSDQRIATVRLIRKRYALLKEHAGGDESYQRDLLCQRAAFMTCILETAEVRCAETGGLDLGSYVQGCNALNGILKHLGLERRVKKAGGLNQYLEQKRNGQ